MVFPVSGIFTLKLLQEFVVFQLLAPEQYTDQKNLLHRFLASDLMMIGAEAVLQMHVNKAHLKVGFAAFRHHVAVASF